jgi:predicted ATP-grasp superfamily ATP-dependent carboligase
MMKILVAGVSVRAMVESAVGSGYQTVALDAFGDQDLKALAETYSLRHDFHVRYSAQAVLKAARKLDFDAIAYTADFENHPDILAQFAADHLILGNSPQVVRSVRNWPNLFARLRRAGFPVPETVFPIENPKPDLKRRWLIKPLGSGGGHGIVFLRAGEMPGNSFMIQEYLPGKPCSISFVANGRECVVLGITEQLTGLRPFGSQAFRYCGNLLPCSEAARPGSGKRLLEQARELAAFLTREYKLTGANGIDIMLEGGQMCLLEVNPRYSASMELIEQAYGLPVFHLHARAVLDGTLPPFDLETVVAGGKYFGKAILFAEKEAVAPDTRLWPARALRDIPASGEPLPKGGPVCTILASQPTREETLADLARKAETLRKELYA